MDRIPVCQRLEAVAQSPRPSRRRKASLPNQSRPNAMKTSPIEVALTGSNGRLGGEL